MPTSLYASILTEYGTQKNNFFATHRCVVCKIYEACSWQCTLIFPYNLGGKVHVMRIFCRMLRNCFPVVILLADHPPPPPVKCLKLPRKNQCSNFRTIYGVSRNRVGIGMSYWPAWLQKLAESIPWNRFLGSLKV